MFAYLSDIQFYLDLSYVIIFGNEWGEYEDV
jgi:hypothetical protein